MERTLISVYYVDNGMWLGNGCTCCESVYFGAWNFSCIEGVENPTQYENCDYEMYNGTKTSTLDCLMSVFWDMVADQESYEDFYEMCESFDGVAEDNIVAMLSDKGIEVIFY